MRKSNESYQKDNMMTTRALRVCVHCPGGHISSPACATAMCDLVKYILYQKLQVPYCYDFLRLAVHKKRGHPEVRESLQSSRHFRTVSLTFESLETIFKALDAEMTSSHPPVEVCLLLGATLMACREAYRLVLPSRRHKASCSMDHLAAGHQLSSALLKTLTTSEIFDEMIIKPLAPTNLHILIRKSTDGDNSPSPPNPQHFAPSRGCRIPRNAKLAFIRLPDIDQNNLGCCSDFEIFEDFAERESKSDVCYSEESSDVCVIESTDRDQWFEASVVVKGFKDCCVNGSSIANEWLKL